MKVKSMDTQDARLAEPEAGQELRARMGTLWRLKACATAGGMVLFFAAYFWVLRHPVRKVTIMPLTALDGWVGSWPGALVLYASLWIYVSLLPALLRDQREMADYAWRALALSVVGLGIFVIWPTAVPVREIEGAGHAGFEWLRQIDATGNACPSLHVAFAVFTAVGLGRVLREMGAGAVVRAGNWLWGVGICYSTLATGQHVAWDVAAGTALGAAAAIFFRRRGRR